MPPPSSSPPLVACPFLFCTFCWRGATPSSTRSKADGRGQEEEDVIGRASFAFKAFVGWKKIAGKARYNFCWSPRMRSSDNAARDARTSPSPPPPHFPNRRPPRIESPLSLPSFFLFPPPVFLDFSVDFASVIFGGCRPYGEGIAILPTIGQEGWGEGSGPRREH